MSNLKWPNIEENFKPYFDKFKRVLESLNSGVNRKTTDLTLGNTLNFSQDIFKSQNMSSMGLESSQDQFLEKSGFSAKFGYKTVVFDSDEEGVEIGDGNDTTFDNTMIGDSETQFSEKSEKVKPKNWKKL